MRPMKNQEKCHMYAYIYIHMYVCLHLELNNPFSLIIHSVHAFHSFSSISTPFSLIIHSVHAFHFFSSISTKKKRKKMKDQQKSPTTQQQKQQQQQIPSADKRLVWLPADCWLDVLSQCGRPFAATQFSFVSQRFAALAARHLWTKRHQLAPLFVICERIGWLTEEEQQQFVERPIPTCVPPKNFRLSTITVIICNCLDSVFNLLCQLCTVRSFAIQMDASVADPCRLRLFERPEFGTILALTKRIRLAHHPVWGMPLAAFFGADSKLEKARQSLLKVPFLECKLVSEADLDQLLFWLHYCSANDAHQFSGKIVKKQLHLFCEHFSAIKLVLAFIRKAIQIFSRSTDPCQFIIKFVMPNFDDASFDADAFFNNAFLLFSSVHYNFATGETLNLSSGDTTTKMDDLLNECGGGGSKSAQQQMILLERRKIDKMRQLIIDDDVCEEEETMTDADNLINEKRNDEDFLLIFK